MSDLTFFASGAIIILLIVAVLAAMDTLGKCNHLWGEWSYKEDSACFFQKRQCVKCKYTEFQQIRKVPNETEHI